MMQQKIKVLKKENKLVDKKVWIQAVKIVKKFDLLKKAAILLNYRRIGGN